VIDALEALLRTFGPFVIPVALFVAGLVGYGILVALGRAGIVGADEDDGPESGDGWERR
jgi:hypothetical protein